MATLSLLAAAGMSARVVPLLHGPVLITGVDRAGKLLGLSKMQRILAQRHKGANHLIAWPCRQPRGAALSRISGLLSGAASRFRDNQLTSQGELSG